MSQNFQEAHFGLDRAKEASLVTVTFPSGTVRTLEHVKANQIIAVSE